MVFVSVTRLRIRSLRFMPWFVIRTMRTLAQAKRASGLVAGSVLADRKRTFWTMTLWHGQGDMRRYMTGGDHLKAMPKLLDWCDEASVVHWEQLDPAPPSWDEADRRMRREGRASKVRHPSPAHPSLAYAPLRTSRAVSIVPAPGV